jgi:hypothetical protein
VSDNLLRNSIRSKGSALFKLAPSRYEPPPVPKAAKGKTRNSYKTAYALLFLAAVTVRVLHTVVYSLVIYLLHSCYIPVYK